MMEIAVLGGGNGCYAAAADLSEAGHAVRFWRRDAKAFGPLLDSGVIHVRDHAGARDVPIPTVTADLAAAVSGAALVVIPLPATAQAGLFQNLAPHLTDDQVVYLPPGTFGSYMLIKAMRDAANPAKVVCGETGTLPWLVRKQGEADIRISVRATRLPTGCFPANRHDHGFETIRAAFPAAEPCEDALSGALMNAGPIIHPPLIMMNAGPMEHFEKWDIHNEGTQPSIRRTTDKLDSERIAVREAFGYAPPHFPLVDHYDDSRDEWMYGDSSHEKLTDSGDWREDIDLTSHRYMLEDVETGLAFLCSCAAFADVDAPVADGLLAIGGAINGRDFRQTGRTLKSLGLDRLSQDALLQLLHDGI